MMKILVIIAFLFFIGCYTTERYVRMETLTVVSIDTINRYGIGDILRIHLISDYGVPYMLDRDIEYADLYWVGKKIENIQ